MRPLVGINRLPDELLSPIVAELGDDKASLRSLARVSKRFYEPARRRTMWIVRGIDQLLALLDFCLRAEPPVFRDSCWRLTLTYANKDARRSLPLADRLIATILEECVQLRSVAVGGIFADAQAICRALVAISKLPFLQDLVFCHAHNAHLDLPLLHHALPVFAHLEELRLGLDGSRGFHGMFVALSPFEIRNVSLQLSHCTLEEIQVLVRLFVQEAQVARVKMIDVVVCALTPARITDLFKDSTHLSLELLFSLWPETDHSRPLPFPREKFVISVLAQPNTAANGRAYVGRSLNVMKGEFWASFGPKAFGSDPAFWKVEVQGRLSAPRDFDADELEGGLKSLGLGVKWVS